MDILPLFDWGGRGWTELAKEAPWFRCASLQPRPLELTVNLRNPDLARVTNLRIVRDRSRWIRPS